MTNLLSSLPHDARDLMEPLLQEMRPYLGQAKKFERLIDIKAPDTSIAKFELIIQAMMSRIDEMPVEQVKEIFERLLPIGVRALSHPAIRGSIVSSYARAAEKADRSMRRKAVGRSLLALVDATNARVHNASAVIALEQYMGAQRQAVTPREILETAPVLTAEATMKAECALGAALGLRGESRCRALVAAAGAPTEVLYSRYLRMIDAFLQVIKNRKPLSATLTFGELVRRVHGDLPPELSSLVDADVTVRRNASCHGTWKYLPNCNSVEYPKRNHPRQVASLGEYQDQVTRAIRTASYALNEVLPAIFQRDLMVRSGVIEANLASFLISEDGQVQLRGDEMQECYLRAFSPYMGWRLALEKSA